MEHAAYESTGPGGTLHWRERSDRHWIARGMGGHFDAAPTRSGGYQLYWMSDAGSDEDLGHHSTLGAAWYTARLYADGNLRRSAAEPAAAAEGSPCAHTHPETVPSAPCPADAGGGSDGPVVIEKTEVAASQTTIVAAEETRQQRFVWKTTKDGAEAVLDDAHVYRITKVGRHWETKLQVHEKGAKFAWNIPLGEHHPSMEAAKRAAAAHWRRHHETRVKHVRPKAQRGARQK